MDHSSSHTQYIPRRHVVPQTGLRVRAVVKCIFCCLTAVLVLVQAGPNAADLTGIKPEDVVTKFPDIPWRLKADEVSYDQKANVYIARGHVELSKADKKLTADYIRFDRNTMRAYGHRMWIDEMYGDWKGHGVGVEKTRLRHVDRLSRLVFLVALLYLWLIIRGTQAIKQGLRHLVDRKGRRDLSLVRIGLDITHWLSASGRSFSIRLLPYF